jgi:hypothetical protein
MTQYAHRSRSGVCRFFSAEVVNTPYPLITSNGRHQTAMPRVVQLFLHLQNNLIPVAIERYAVSLYATQDDTQQVLSLLFKLISKHEIKDKG